MFFGSRKNLVHKFLAGKIVVGRKNAFRVSKNDFRVRKILLKGDKIKQNINQTSYFRPKYLKNIIIVYLLNIIVKGVTNPVRKVRLHIRKL